LKPRISLTVDTDIIDRVKHLIDFVN
jgi:hypothetical protein